MEKPDKITCPVCESGEDKLSIAEKTGVHTVYLCNNCSLKFAYPMTGFLQEDYESSYDKETYFYIWEFREALRFIPKVKKRILDIGCGMGLFLSKLKEYGHEVSGIDINRKVVDAAKACGVDKIYAMDLDVFSKSYPDIKFDVVTFFNLLEHLDSLNGFLQGVRNVLKPDGLIVFCVPNQKRFIRRFTKKRLFDLPPHHLTFWSENSIKYLLENNGFEGARIETRVPRNIVSAYYYIDVFIYLIFRSLISRIPIIKRIDNRFTKIVSVFFAILASPFIWAVFNVFRMQSASVYGFARKKV